MFLHIGNSKVVALKELIGIFDTNLKSNMTNNQFLESFPGGRLPQSEKDASNSFVITTNKVYYSPISPTTLQKRILKKIHE